MVRSRVDPRNHTAYFTQFVRSTMLLRVVAHRGPQAICAKYSETEGRNSQTSEWLRDWVDPGIIPSSNRTILHLVLQVGPLEFQTAGVVTIIALA